MRILFSPVGTADPLTILGEGPLLQIVRNYQPQKIVLFLSPEMAKYEDVDSRYTLAIEKLANEELGIETPEIQEERSERTDVHRYDFYIEDFSQILTRLHDENPDAEIIVNVSSGTPAMEQALVALDAFGRLGLRAIQVATPKKGTNDPGDREDPNEYSLDTLWKLNLENEHRNENRCIEVESAHFGDLLLRDNTRALVNNYDYVAASILADQSKTFPSEAKGLIDGCVERMNLNYSKAANFFKGTDFAFDPNKKLQEYLGILEVCLERQQWADYLRAMTPAFFETLCVYINRYMDKRYPDKKWLLRGDANKLNVSAVDGLEPFEQVFDMPQLKEQLKERHKNPILHTSDLVRLIKRMYPEENQARKDLEQLRELEKAARNQVAHSIVRVDKKNLEKTANISLDKSLNLLFKLNKAQKGLYRNINKAILDLLV